MCRNLLVSNENFVRKYMTFVVQNQRSISEFADEIGLSTARIYQRARDMRKAGVKLPKASTTNGRSRINTKELNKIINQRLKKIHS